MPSDPPHCLGQDRNWAVAGGWASSQAAPSAGSGSPCPAPRLPSACSGSLAPQQACGPKQEASLGQGGRRARGIPASSRQRRSASQREKLRMRRLAQALHTLRRYLPAAQSLTKIETLRLATCYIGHLSELLGHRPWTPVQRGLDPVAPCCPQGPAGLRGCLGELPAWDRPTARVAETWTTSTHCSIPGVLQEAQTPGSGAWPLPPYCLQRGGPQGLDGDPAASAETWGSPASCLSMQAAPLPSSPPRILPTWKPRLQPPAPVRRAERARTPMAWQACNDEGPTPCKDGVPPSRHGAPGGRCTQNPAPAGFLWSGRPLKEPASLEMTATIGGVRSY